MRRALAASLRGAAPPCALLSAAGTPPHAAAAAVAAWRAASSCAAPAALPPPLPPHARDAWLRRPATACAGFAAAGLQRRGYAKESGAPPRSGMTPPASTAGLQRGGLRIVMFSPNLIAEPYKGPPPPLPIHTLFTAAGWRERWNRVLGRVKNVYALAKVKKDVPDWTLPSFKEEACALYKEVCAAIAAGDHHELRHRTTESLLANIKREMKQREAGGWARVEWSLSAVEECAVVHGRLVAPNPKDTTIAWAQLTVALKSTQRFAAYDKAGRRVAGDPDVPISVQDYWVLERSLLPNTPEGLKRWRAAARLTLPPAAA